MDLKPITPTNRTLAGSLRVSPDQERFVASSDKTLADADANHAALLRLACVARRPVGYLLLLPIDLDEHRLVNIARLVIDQRWQGRGFGRQLLRTALC